MKIHGEGGSTLSIVFIILLVVNVILYFVLSTFLFYLILSASLVFFAFITGFFRVPSRKVISDNNIIYSPADGKIVAIEETGEKEYFHEKRLQISVFMSPLNVHVNWYPAGGKVSYIKYHKGKYLVAWHPKSSEENERATIVIDTKDNNKILVRQIAGAVARRIVTYPKVNDEVMQGNEMGFIKFGSRLDVLLPLDVIPLVKLGQKVKGSLTPLASFR